VVNPGARDPARRWPAARFAEVARALADEGVPVVLTGTGDEAPLTHAIASAVPAGAVLDLGGRTTLGALAALVDGARLVVTNDTGVSHVAAARRVPSVIVFTASERERWAPADGLRHVAVGSGASNRCGEHAPDGRHRCLGDACSAGTARPLAVGGSRPPLPAVPAVLRAVWRQVEAGRAVPA
jgi:ADP-heptose:LPS heptosyltransferase